VNIFTIGYEGIKLGEFLDTLHARGITRLIDVREHAFSMKRGFSKTPLKNALEAAEIAYEHHRVLGAPKPVRVAYKATADWVAYCKSYEAYLDTQTEALETLSELARTESIVLLCFEANPLECHRSLIANRLKETGLVNVVTHITTRKTNLDFVPVG
jgi:uncharacterized protein (DUF488 family)